MSLFNLLKRKQDALVPVFGSFTDERDRHVYKTVQFGNQVWMAENWAFIPHVCSPKENGGIWVFNYNGQDTEAAKKTAEYQTLGCLYDLQVVLNTIPKGWHLPTKNEWLTFIRALGEQSGLKSKSKTGWEGKTGNGTDIYGFSFPPGGSRIWYGSFNNLGKKGTWWTSTSMEEAGYTALESGCSNLVVGLNYNSDDFESNTVGSVNSGYSVRLIKDTVIPEKKSNK